VNGEHDAPAQAPESGVEQGEVPRTRAGAAWVGLAGAALVAVAFIIFLVQNTGRVDISFLWMTGRLPLGLLLLITVVAAVLVTASLGTARILQLRRLVHRDRPG